LHTEERISATANTDFLILQIREVTVPAFRLVSGAVTTDEVRACAELRQQRLQLDGNGELARAKAAALHAPFAAPGVRRTPARRRMVRLLADAGLIERAVAAALIEDGSISQPVWVALGPLLNVLDVHRTSIDSWEITLRGAGAQLALIGGPFHAEELMVDDHPDPRRLARRHLETLAAAGWEPVGRPEVEYWTADDDADEECSAIESIMYVLRST
jgi:hypothetical protein